MYASGAEYPCCTFDSLYSPYRISMLLFKNLLHLSTKLQYKILNPFILQPKSVKCFNIVPSCDATSHTVTIIMRNNVNPLFSHRVL